MADNKSVHTLILDTGPLIKNTPSISTLLAASHSLVTIPSVEAEIRDAATRTRFETTVKPFLTFRNPKPESVTVIRDFARRSGDLAVLSRPDVAILALAYELECERNGGDWRLRRTPGQKGLNGRPPPKEEVVKAEEGKPAVEPPLQDEEKSRETEAAPEADQFGGLAAGHHTDISVSHDNTTSQTSVVEPEISEALDNTHLTSTSTPAAQTASDSNGTRQEVSEDVLVDENTFEDASDSDSEGWITPSNLSSHIAADATAATSSPSTTGKSPSMLQVATLTTDFAMQNVLLQMNLNLLSTDSHLTRIRHLKTFVQRCHACFMVVKDGTKQFCPRCGGATLTRVACSTDAQTGEFKLHLKKNFQWNTRGDRFSIPKPVAGSANGRVQGGGKGGWGNELILAEDQKEYQVKMKERERAERRQRKEAWDDPDALPSLLSGERGGQGWSPGSKIRVGAGRNVNSRKRR